jgi:RNA polymerase-binding transcription factor DksA
MTEVLARLEDGIYGDCARCGEPVHPQRLEALPTTHYCIRCQQQLEIPQSGRQT